MPNFNPAYTQMLQDFGQGATAPASPMGVVPPQTPTVGTPKFDPTGMEKLWNNSGGLSISPGSWDSLGMLPSEYIKNNSPDGWQQDLGSGNFRVYDKDGKWLHDWKEGSDLSQGLGSIAKLAVAAYLGGQFGLGAEGAGAATDAMSQYANIANAENAAAGFGNIGMTGMEGVSTLGAAGGASSTFNPAVDSQLANSAIGEGAFGNASMHGLPTASPTMSTGSGLMDLFNKGKGLLGSNLLDGTGLKLTGAQALSSLYDMYAKNKTAGALQDRYNQINSMINNYYAPGSPEANLMKQTMDRQDAAAGRNSQYGVRATDLAAKIAGLKMQAQAQMMGGQNALLSQQLGNQYGGLNSLFGYLNQNNSYGNMMNNQFLSKMFLNLPGFGGKPGGNG